MSNRLKSGNPGSGTGRYIPLPVPTPGISGYTHRWHGSKLVGEAGAAITSWPDVGSAGNVPLNVLSGTGSLAVAAVSGVKYAASIVKEIRGTFSTTGAFTVALIVKAASVSTVAMLFNGITLNRNSSGNWQISTRATGASGSLVTSNATSGWAVIVIGITPGSNTQTLRINSSTYSGTFTPGTSDTLFVLGSAGATNPEVDIEDAVFWPGFAANATQSDAIYQALKAANPALGIA